MKDFTIRVCSKNGSDVIKIDLIKTRKGLFAEIFQDALEEF